MKYLVTAFQEIGNDMTLETSRLLHCRLATARKICRDVFAKLDDNECTMVCVAVWKDDQRMFLMRKGN